MIAAKQAAAGPQLVWIRLGNVRNQDLWSRLSCALGEIADALAAGERVIEVR